MLQNYNGAVNPCMRCGQSHRNTIHVNKGQYGYHEHIPVASKEEDVHQRERFEKWILATEEQTQPFGLVERNGEGYLDLYTQKKWAGWKAALE